MNNKIAVINGPNINILGKREPQYYGECTLDDIISDVEALANKLNYEVSFYQSNFEGQIIEYIQNNSDKFDAIILNPASLSKVGYGILDVINAYKIPFAEVHLSNIFAREQWHSESIFTPYAVGMVVGFKSISYELMLRALIDYLERKNIDK